LPAPPPAPEIAEPVVTVHRFTGKYLGGDSQRALVYVETGAGKAEVQNRPLVTAIPEADADAKDDVKLIELPAGKAMQFERRVFVMTPRALFVVGTDCTLEWKFVLPGKDDNGETLLDVAGFHDGKAFLASQQIPPANKEKEGATGRVYTLDIASGRLVAFTTITGGFDTDAKLILDGSNTLVSLSAARAQVHVLYADVSGSPIQIPALPISHATVRNGMICATTPKGVIAAHPRTWSGVLLADAAGTAPAVLHGQGSTDSLYVPVKTSAGHFALAAFNQFGNPLWNLPVPKAITIAPVSQGQSVFFISGTALYRVNAATGAICWKNTLPVNPHDALTELAFVGGEIRASGPGLVVRVAERPEPQPAVAPPRALAPAGPAVAGAPQQ
jgi:outer membrane protein assembly factor BamB